MNFARAHHDFGRAFAGRTAIVTGGASGIGAALVKALTDAGAIVFCADVNVDGAERVAQQTAATPVHLDVRDAEAVRRLVDRVVAEHGRIDYLFNNAGVVVGGEVRDLTLADWDRVIDVNLRGVVHGVQAAYPHMVAAGQGQIVNTASNAGIIPVGLLTAYSATKFAIVGLSTALRTEAVRHGVRVTVVCPGVIDTPILDQGAVGAFRARAFFEDLAGSKPGCSAQDLARDVLAGVARNEPWVFSPRGAKMAWRFYRLAPRTGLRVMTRAIRQQQDRMASESAT